LGKWIVIVSFFTLACNERSEIGAIFFQETNLDLSFTDTVTLRVSTVMFDSIGTSSPSQLLVGYRSDPELGLVEAKSFFEVGINSTSNTSYYLDRITTSFSKVSLILPYSGYSYYDTVGLQQLYVQLLNDRLDFPDDSDQFYNTTHIDYQRAILGQRSFNPRPTRRDTLEVPLSPVFGELLFEELTRNTTEFLKDDRFYDLVPGFVVSVNPMVSECFLGFSKQVALRLYYMDKAEVPTEEKYVDFSFADRGMLFNQINTDRSATTLEGLSTRKFSIDSRATNNLAFIQAGSVLGLRVEIPYLKQIVLENEDLVITDAILEIVPIRKSDEPNSRFPQALDISAVNHRNDVYAQFESQANLFEDTYLGRSTSYRLDVLPFIRSQLAQEEFNENALLLTIPQAELSSSVTRLWVGNQQSEFEMKLKIYYLTIDRNE
jgi:hypothetical protein